MRTLGLLILILGGCTRPNALPLSGDGGTDCSAHTDRASCAADPRCIVAGCPQCDGSTSFVACVDAHAPPPTIPLACPGIGCSAPCRGLAEATCKARPDCRADYCGNCTGGRVYSQCTEAGAPPATCQAPPCEPACDAVNTQTECDARPDCHAVYEPALCQCNNCCCVFYGRCASGGGANCKGPTTCTIPPPNCTDPACQGAYAVSFGPNGCYEGCVQIRECAP
jgi:hypothetical protein